MAIPIVIVTTGEEPVIVDLNKYQLPDGCSGFMGVDIAGTPCCAPMPCNEFRPKLENTTEYLMALSCARGYLSYGKLKDLDKVRSIPHELLLAMMEDHLKMCMEVVAKMLVTDSGFDVPGVNHLCDVGFLPAHDACCQAGPECKKAIHERVYGKGKPS